MASLSWMEQDSSVDCEHILNHSDRDDDAHLVEDIPNKEDMTDSWMDMVDDTVVGSQLEDIVVDVEDTVVGNQLEDTVVDMIVGNQMKHTVVGNQLEHTVDDSQFEELRQKSGSSSEAVRQAVVVEPSEAVGQVVVEPSEAVEQFEVVVEPSEAVVEPSDSAELFDLVD